MLFRSVVFYETCFPFANPSMHARPVSCPDSSSFPQSEPVIVNDHVNRYDLSLLAPNPSVAGTGHMDVHGTPVHDQSIVQSGAADLRQQTSSPLSRWA